MMKDGIKLLTLITVGLLLAIAVSHGAGSPAKQAALDFNLDIRQTE